ncbi:hypothetical protein JKF63_06057 [Porcisia hertigi]|uniref:Uncharacterized protein n=1 Tax=Porcisia hertigi TaxID=2761500 RepID=A0A836IGG9_9TRYP|nr:hypothetical protein JKF63_06057 [Porcisia hertigi]
MAVSAHHDAVAFYAYDDARFPEASTVAVAPSAAFQAAQGQSGESNTPPLDAFFGSPLTLAKVPLTRLENDVQTKAFALSAPVPSSTTTPAARGTSPHSHQHLLRIIQQQQERIATLQTSLEQAARSAQHSSEALEALKGKRCASVRQGRISHVSPSPSPSSSSPLASTSGAVSTVAATVRWADSAAAVLRVPQAQEPFPEFQDDSPRPDCGSLACSLPSAAPAKCSTLPVILLDITSMFTTKSAHAGATRTHSQQPKPSAQRQSTDTQTECVAAESATHIDSGTHDSSDAMERLVDQLRSELDESQRKQHAAESSIVSLRASMLALKQRHAVSGVSSCRSSDAVSPSNDSAGASRDVGVVSGANRVTGKDGPEKSVVYQGANKEAEELRRLRLLLRFSELKKDSDRLEGVENTLRECSAARLHLQERCDGLVREKEQLRVRLQEIASSIETVLASTNSSAWRNRIDDRASATSVPLWISGSPMAFLESVLRMCREGAAPPVGGQKAPPPSAHVSPPPSQQSSVPLRQHRLHQALSDSRDDGVLPPSSLLPRKASWLGTPASAAAVHGQRRASKR